MRERKWLISITGRFFALALALLLSHSADAIPPNISHCSTVYIATSFSYYACQTQQSAIIVNSYASGSQFCTAGSITGTPGAAICGDSVNNVNAYWDCQPGITEQCYLPTGQKLSACSDGQDRDSSLQCVDLNQCPTGTTGTYPICNGSNDEGHFVDTQPKSNDSLPSCDSVEYQQYSSQLCSDLAFQCNQGDLQKNIQHKNYCNSPDFDPNKAYQHLQWMDPAGNNYIDSNTRSCYSNAFEQQLQACQLNDPMYCYDAAANVWVGSCDGQGSLKPNKDPSCDTRKYILNCENVFVCANGVKEPISADSPYYTDPANCDSNGNYYENPQSDSNNSTGGDTSGTTGAFTDTGTDSGAYASGEGGQGTGGGGFGDFTSSGGYGGLSDNGSSSGFVPCNLGDPDCVDANTGGICQGGSCVTVKRGGISPTYRLSKVDTIEQSNKRLLDGMKKGPTIEGLEKISKMDLSGSCGCPPLRLDTGHAWFGIVETDAHCQMIEKHKFFIQMMARLAWVVAAAFLFLGA